MADIVLVHGAWHGSWCWRRVVPLLWLAGHRVVTVTLTGLGERAHQLSPEITLGTHVDDVVTAMRAEECSARGPGRAQLRRAGDHRRRRSAGRRGRPARVRRRDRARCRGRRGRPATRRGPGRPARGHRAGTAPCPRPAVAFGLTGADADWVGRRQTPQPAASTTTRCTSTRAPVRPGHAPSSTARPALPTIEPSRQLVRSQPGWEVVELATGHDPMVSEPGDLAAVLLTIAER